MSTDYYNGPDQIVPAENYVITKQDEYVRLRVPESGKAIETLKPISIPGMLKSTVEQFPNSPALGYKDGNKWKTISYQEYWDQIRIVAKAFIHLGLEKRHSVCILGFNSPEWFISYLAGIFARGIAVGIYTTNSPEACYHCLSDSKANIVVVQDEKQLEKILSIKSRLPHLKTIIQYEGEPTNDGILSWKKIIEIGQQQTDDLLDERMKTIAINECCTIVYTSGTVGNPKGVLLSHDNYVWTTVTIFERIPVKPGNEQLVSYLPLSHVAAQLLDLHVAYAVGGTVYFADKNALKGTLVNTLKEIQPTKFLAVPRVWEKIYEKMQQVAAESGPIKKAISSWAKNQALQHHTDRINGKKSHSWGYTVASNMIFSRVKQALGLNRCTYQLTGAAPLSVDIKRYFLSIDVPIMDCFGMSECAGCYTMSTEDAYKIDSIGTTLPGMKAKILNQDESGQGELCMYGRQVFMGYNNLEDKTEETIDDDGWLHTGDLARIDDKGFVSITGRLKELIITAGGENVPPVPIEHLVKSELPQISNAFLVGEKRKFLSILLAFKTEVDDNGTPLDTLLPSVQEWLKELGCKATTVTELLNSGPDSRILDALKEGIDRVNLVATSNAQRIQKLTILPVDFSIPTGEFGPTMKVKRSFVEEKYKDLINKMYDV